ncbi:acyl-[acyl-carrier-protein]--UDP-N-acetylglucosamine O-acyltransferase, partial [Francisella tularensis subsp. holarctica]|nr:acyl-[acyl-carrier-protein]--UDP-N-acetylglucosamine O-acyltransferase [Francisella tularensis subsp. holarctica]
MVIHSLAVVHESAKIADSSIIGPFWGIGKN